MLPRRPLSPGQFFLPAMWTRLFCFSSIQIISAFLSLSGLNKARENENFPKGHFTSPENKTDGKE